MRHLVTICCLCEKVRDGLEVHPGTGVWKVSWEEFKVYRNKYGLKPADIRITHTYCPNCLASYRAFLRAPQEAGH